MEANIEGWEWAELGNLVSLVRGVSYSKADVSATPKEGYVPILRGNNIQDGRLDFSDLVWVRADCIDSSQFLREGDIVLTMSSGSADLVGKAAEVRGLPLSAAFGAFCGVLRPRYLPFSDWISLFLQSRHRATKSCADRLHLG